MVGYKFSNYKLVVEVGGYKFWYYTLVAEVGLGGYKFQIQFGRRRSRRLQVFISHIGGRSVRSPTHHSLNFTNWWQTWEITSFQITNWCQKWTITSFQITNWWQKWEVSHWWAGGRSHNSSNNKLVAEAGDHNQC